MDWRCRSVQAACGVRSLAAVITAMGCVLIIVNGWTDSVFGLQETVQALTGKQYFVSNHRAQPFAIISRGFG
jgi:hypothetical protein